MNIAGKYDFVSSDNYDEFLKACGNSHEILLYHLNLFEKLNIDILLQESAWSPEQWQAS